MKTLPRTQIRQLVRVSGLEGYAEQVLELGGIPEALYERAHFDPALLKQPSNLMPYQTFLYLLHLAAEETGTANFGLLLSRRQSLTTFGTVGLIMKQTTNVRGAWRELIRHFHIHNQGATLKLSEDKGIAFLSFLIHAGGERGFRQQEDLAAGIGLNVMKMFCGPHWRPLRFNLSHKSMRNKCFYEQFLEAPVYFNQECSGMVMDSSDLNIKLQGSDQQLYEILNQHLGIQSSKNKQVFSDNLKRVITKAMLEGDCSIEMVSRYMATNKRTLQRKLQRRKLTYKMLLDDARFDTAIKYLRGSTMPLTQISEILCYSNLSGFSRAFKRHCGVNPGQWREHNQPSK